jgi:ubiquinone/menaquinone biosynthesis C-methylase UbiE
MMTTSERIERIIEYHRKEAEDEYRREVGDDPVYDEITWNNIEPFLPRRGWILDAGGGAGPWAIKMAERVKCSVVVLDITSELLKTAKRKACSKTVGEHIETLRADIRSIPHPDRQFDFVLCEADPICICGSPERAVSELSRVLRLGGYLVAGVDSTFYRAFRALSEGKPLDDVLDFLQTEMAPAEDGAPFESKSFTPNELIALLGKHGLETVRIVGKPIGFGPRMLDPFVAAIPRDTRQHIFKDAAEKKRMVKMLRRIYDDTHIAGMGSHLHVVAVKSS